LQLKAKLTHDTFEPLAGIERGLLGSRKFPLLHARRRERDARPARDQFGYQRIFVHGPQTRAARGLFRPFERRVTGVTAHARR
jgi:hypothetical protein